jgi:23S rRNA (pseudouridine1915-N3)-methyltransferase
MEIKIISIGKTKEKYLKAGIKDYLDRLSHFGRIKYTEGKAIKTKGDHSRLRSAEAEWIEKQLGRDDFLVLLDENGQALGSRQLAGQMNQWMTHLRRPISFVIGGAFGFDERLKERADFTLSLSNMTFSHQMVRLIFLEQLYRAFTILAGHAYHND